MFAATISRYFTPDPHYAERNAYNAAFYELGLRWHWDSETYRELQSTACEKERIRRYVKTHQPHLLTAYDVDFLVNAIETTKARHANSGTQRLQARCRPVGRAAEIGF